MEGWIKLHRKMRDNPIYRNSRLVHCFIEFLLRATHKDTSFYSKYEKLTLQPGQFVFGYEELSKFLRCSYGTAVRIVSVLKAESIIDIKSTNKGSIGTILKWKAYQVVDSKVDNRMITDGYQNDTINKVKNDKNVKNIPNGIQKVAYGSKDVNELIAYMKERLQIPVLDESERVNRMYAQNCLTKFGGVDKVKLLLDATAQHEFWSTRITNFKTLYYKAVQIISSGRDTKGGVKQL